MLPRSEVWQLDQSHAHSRRRNERHTPTPKPQFRALSFRANLRYSRNHTVAQLLSTANKASMISRSRERTQRMKTSWSIESRGKSPSTTAVTTTWFSVIAPL